MPIDHTTWDGQPAVELTTDRLRLVAVYGYGPRIAWFGPTGGDNLLFWPEDPEPYKREQAALGKEDWYLRGGHRLWVSKHLADESAETYRPDNAAGSCLLHADGFTLLAADDGIDEIRRGITVRIVDDHRLMVDHHLENTGPLLASGGLWGLTCSRPGEGTRYVVPLGDGSQWDTATVTLFRTWAGGQGQGVFADDQFRVVDDAYLLEPAGRENKRMLANPAGIIAMSDPQRGCTFAIRCDWDAHALYPGNANLALFVGADNFMVEMETMGPLRQAKPGERIDHREEWLLHPEAIEATGAAARGVFD